MGAGQVLHCPYNFEQTKIVVKEMIDQLALDLVDKRLVTDQIVLTIGYDIKNLEQGTKKNVGRSRQTGMAGSCRNMHTEPLI